MSAQPDTNSATEVPPATVHTEPAPPTLATTHAAAPAELGIDITTDPDETEPTTKGKP
jgi:hypothetical protein